MDCQWEHLTLGRPTKVTPRAQYVIVHEVTRVTSMKLKPSLVVANISVHESIMRRTLSNNGVHGGVVRRKPLLSRKNIAVCDLQFAQGHVDKPEDFWKNALWTEEPK